MHYPRIARFQLDGFDKLLILEGQLDPRSRSLSLQSTQRLLGIKRHADLQQSRIRDRRRRQPGPERLVHGQDRAAVQGVVEVEIDGRSGS